MKVYGNVKPQLKEVTKYPEASVRFDEDFRESLPPGVFISSSDVQIIDLRTNSDTTVFMLVTAPALSAAEGATLPTDYSYVTFAVENGAVGHQYLIKWTTVYNDNLTVDITEVILNVQAPIA